MWPYFIPNQVWVNIIFQKFNQGMKKLPSLSCLNINQIVYVSFHFNQTEMYKEDWNLLKSHALTVHEMASHPLAQFDLILAWASWKLLWAT